MSITKEQWEAIQPENIKKRIGGYRYENDLQKAVAYYLDIRGCIWFHPPNGGLRNKREAAKLKAMGTKPGVPDVIILDPQIVIELKIKGNKPTPEQNKWLETFKTLGWRAYVCRSLDEVREILEESK